MKTFKDFKDVIKRIEEEFEVQDSDLVYVDVWETIRIIGDHKDIVIDLDNDKEIIY